MKFRSHQIIIIEQIENALTKQKSGLVEDFKHILIKANELYKTDSFNFWLDTLNCTNLNNLPITKLGYTEAVIKSKHLRDYDKNRVKSSIENICELLFTYSNEDTFCDLQGYFHFYFSISQSCIFKISELGFLEGAESNEIGDYRIAYTSDLEINENELYL